MGIPGAGGGHIRNNLKYFHGHTRGQGGQQPLPPTVTKMLKVGQFVRESRTKVDKILAKFKS